MPKIPIPNTDLLIEDPFYRYKRDRIEVSTSGRFHVITNFRLICKQLDMKTIEEERLLVDYFKKSLKQPVIYDQEHGTVKMKSLPVSLEQILEKFIGKYILCAKCGLPELNKDRVCKSCGKDNQ